MIANLALAALLPLLATAVPCVQFDTSWNLYAFGGSQDVNLGQSSSWAQPNVTPLTSTGRPPWTGNNTQCLLSEYNNAMYVTGADASDYSKVYIYSFGSNTWSTQSTSSAPTAPQTRSAVVLDHDTNVIFAFTNGGLTQLDMSSITSSAQSSALAWEGVSAPSWGSGYSGSATAAQASNHILYFGVPNTAAGSAQLFVVHYAYWQPQAQSFASSSGGQAFPDTAGQAFSIPSGVSGGSAPNSVVFVPSDFSSTYVIDHWTNPSSYSSTDGSPYAANLINTTSTLPAPPTKEAQAAYAASPSSLVQITTSGEINYIANAVGSGKAVSGATWSKLNYQLQGATGGSASSGSSSSASASASAGGMSSASASASGTGSRSASGSASASAGSAAASAASSRAAAGQVATVSNGVLGGMGAMVLAVMAGMGMML